MKAGFHLVLWVQEIFSLLSAWVGRIFSAWVGRISFAVATFISVLLVPLLVVIFEGGAAGFERVSWVVGTASLALIFLAAVFSYAASLASRREEFHVLKSARLLLVSEFAEVQGMAEIKFPSLAGRSPIAVRNFLLENGIWTRDDILGFDDALRVRNSIVHSSGELSKELAASEALVVSGALEVVRHLQRKIQESEFFQLNSSRSKIESSKLEDEAASGAFSGEKSSPREVRFITVAEVATIMRISKMTAYRMIDAGVLPAIKVGRSYRVPEEAVRYYIDSVMIADRNS